MPDINDMRRQRAEAAQAMQDAAEQLTALEGADGEPDEAELATAQTAFETAQSDFAKIDKQVKRQEEVEAATASSAVSETAPAGTGATTPTAPAAAVNPADNGIEIGFLMQALTNSRGDLTGAVASLEAAGHSGISAALSGATPSAGGVTIPEAQSGQIIDMLRSRVAVRQAGARSMPMPAGQIRDAKQTGSATASYGAENGAAIESEQTFGAVDKSFKTLKALVPVGNALLRHNSTAIARVIRDDMIDVMSLREDLGFMRDQGADNTPYGLRFWTPPTNWMAGVANGAAAVEQALRALKSKVEDANVAMISPAWIMRGSTKNFLASLREPEHGSYLFPSIDRDGTLFGYPIQTTSQIPSNLGLGGDETEVYFGDFNEVMIGDAMAVTIATSTEAAYVDQAGNTVSAFQNDLTLMRAISEHDLAPNHVEALAGLNGVGWGF